MQMFKTLLRACQQQSVNHKFVGASYKDPLKPFHMIMIQIHLNIKILSIQIFQILKLQDMKQGW